MQQRLIHRGEAPIKKFAFNATGSIQKCAEWTFTGMPIHNGWSVSTAKNR